MAKPAPQPAPHPCVVLITKANCHLCADARDAVGRVTAALGLGWSERSIDDDAGLRERYAEEIPVLLVDGVQRDFWRIDEARLARTLRRALGQTA
ncbi:glutaredoxin family protein [Arthrobacter sp. UYEF3]|uniref:glutaredoxin family protein n=1 Tax=Arthrobacter sp. UYEF3 TaxID=1756365 RepID=UPI00339363A9